MYFPYKSACKNQGQTVAVEGKVVSFPEKDGKEGFSNTKTEIVLKTVYGKIAIYDYFSDIGYGDILKTKLLLYRPSPQRNPGGFDEKKYYERKGIYLKGKITGENPVVIENKANIFYRGADSFRNSLAATFVQSLPERQSGLIRGILTGDRSGISREDSQMLRNSGLFHITAVSGVAVSFIYFPLKALIGKIKTGKRKKVGIIIAFLVFFGTVANWTPSVTRAVFMVLVVIAAGLCHRKISSFRALCISLTAAVIFNPLFVLSVGFWLSASATAGIILLYKRLSKYAVSQKGIKKYFFEGMALNISANISIFPITIIFFGQFTFASLFSNIFAMPFVQFSILWGVITASAGLLPLSVNLTHILSIPLHGALSIILAIADFVSGIGFLRIYMPSGYRIFAAGVFVLIIFHIIFKLKRKTVLTVFIMFFTLNSIHLAFINVTRPDMKIVFADVCQGDATLIMLKTGESILIDGGGARKGFPAVAGIMDYYSIEYPTIYIVTHTHEDHCGGITRLINERGGKVLFVPVFSHLDVIETNKLQVNKNIQGGNFYVPSEYSGEQYLGFELLFAAHTNGLEVIETGLGDVIKINEEFKMTVLNPEKRDFPGREKGGNESSLVIYIEFMEHRIIVMGDATARSETMIVDLDFDVSSDIYRISHHGSRTSTNHDIIEAVDSDMAIISSGINFYGHPSDETISRLEEYGCLIYRTDRWGAIIFSFFNNKKIYRKMIN